MNKKFSEKYKNQKESIEIIIDSFTTTGELFGNGDRNTIKLFDLEGVKVNVKSFKVPHLINKIVYRFFRDSKANRSFTFGEKLLSIGVLTPCPIAYFEEKKGFFLLRSYYLSEHQDCDLTYRDLVENPTYKNHEEILRAFTKFTYQLHEKGVLFKDHSPGNTLIKIKEEGYGFYLVDLNRMDFKALDFETRIKNFSRLSPKKEMIAVMANEYAKLIGIDESIVFDKMWEETEAFQKKYHDKIALKKKLFFWKKKYRN